jgi:hypothetical protein
VHDSRVVELAITGRAGRFARTFALARQHPQNLGSAPRAALPFTSNSWRSGWRPQSGQGTPLTRLPPHLHATWANEREGVIAVGGLLAHDALLSPRQQTGPAFPVKERPGRSRLAVVIHSNFESAERRPRNVQLAEPWTLVSATETSLPDPARASRVRPHQLQPLVLPQPSQT